MKVTKIEDHRKNKLMKNLDSEIKKNIDSKNYDEVIRLLDNETNMSPYHCTVKATCIQLSENTKYTLEDVERLLLKAIEIDGKYLQPYIELGYFYHSVLENEDKAEYFFSIAKKILRDYLVEILIGDFQVRNETGTEKNIIDLLNAFKDSVFDDKDFSHIVKLAKAFS
ncbi:MAG: hypothetical protein H7A25_12900 [Leptospiraceae bacterium]|nr:hypothetical protein [Leptospiraceae bacterium]MCP5500798.1 hypothetical protein [Leptospiraceae bacterium]